MSQITKFARIALWLALAGFAGATLIIASAFLYLSPNLPPVEALRDVKLQTPLRIYTQDHALIGEFGEKRRTPVDFEDIPPLLISAVLAAEDDRFYDHHGVDIKGLLRAASQLLMTGSIQTGGSTITMQVAKNYFLSHERTFSRKFNEIFLALQIEQELSKEEILELYLNKIFLGKRAYGIEAAAQVYYGKTIKDLELNQLAMLAGLPKGPSSLNPIANPSRAIIRRNWILGRMLELGYINNQDYQIAIAKPISASTHGTQLDVSAAYVAELAHQEMLKRYGRNAYTEGYSVYTTIKAPLQNKAQQAVVDGLLAYDERHGYRGPEQQLIPKEGEDSLSLWQKTLSNTPALGGLIPAVIIQVNDEGFDALLNSGETVTVAWQPQLAKTRSYVTVNSRSAPYQSPQDFLAIGDLIRLKKGDHNLWQLSQLPAAQAALVSLDSSNGAILSLVGGFDYQQSKFNRVSQAARQPGSNFKPFIYTAALEKGYTPATLINDAPIVFEDASLENTWRPTNSSGKFLGPTRLRQALYQSRNLVSIRLLRSLGINHTIDYISRFGFDTEQLPRDLSLALGSHSVTPMSIVSAYSAIANGGYKVNPYIVERIVSLDGSILFEAKPDTVCTSCEKEKKPAATEELATLEDILQQDAPLPPAQRIIEPRTAYLIDSMMRDVVKKGTGRKALALRRNDLAGKTGTTNGPTDAWFSGYGGGVVTTAWLGFDNNALLGRREYGGSAALPIWIDFMSLALKGQPEVNPVQPEGIVTVKIDPDTGLLAKPGQSNAIFEYFRAENTPKRGSEDNSSPSDIFNEALREDIF
ncbi:penicillin-binding protein 1A [Dasania sp. GY-MA-18]|uniref:Penicillin-binding protein 1A n=1 Tax=Dasania phycosphaerae TaxID=2950436 RepID=A0A9J6RKH1_9GAMM|nr:MULTISPECIES: penicillin-binding protein 1A [Dasania]MCR8922421.1 penicillin-binding protein 1A [Dasania sp. GY-MA-18]MCZ0864849.1 penicillin-binding protein 1A [Dasania phycosphaerae]MCZ0868577.1 penicillin-binding protein 1A [Dasania phycosphaerae]